MDDKERIAWAINWIKKDRKTNNYRLSKLWGVDNATVARYSGGRGIAKGPVLSSLVKDFGFNGEWLISGKGEPFPMAREKYPDVCGPLEFNGLREITADYSQYQPDFPPDEFVFIRQMRGRISAGDGIVPDDTADVQCAFRRDWFKRRGRPENMTLIKVSGDSMSPSLLVGDIVMVDHSWTSIQAEGGIYAISINNEIMIKRLQLQYQNQKILVISDNKQYPSQEIDADKITINGKVIWYARELEK